MNAKPDEQIFAQAIEVANIPTLLMVLVQENIVELLLVLQMLIKILLY